MNSTVRRAGIVVPAHNEEGLIDRCLRSLAVASRRAPVPVRVIVVLDDCSDRTEDRCRRHNVEVRTISARNVGVARATGATVLLAAESEPQSVWLASTDADSEVEPDWLRHQIELARAGADVVLGLVRLHDGTLHGPVRRAFEHHYARLVGPGPGHGHVHGANLGVRGDAYLRAGGFEPRANHEDRELLQRLSRLDGLTIHRSVVAPVWTSGRVRGRCDQGFAPTLARLAGTDRSDGSPPAA